MARAPWNAGPPRACQPLKAFVRSSSDEACDGDFCTTPVPSCTLYAMTTMTVSAARQNLPGAVEQAQTEPVVLERYGRAAAVLVSPEHYARLVAALEDAEDVEAFDAAMAEEGANIPWEQAKTDLGWE